MRQWEDDYAEFVTASAWALRRQAYERCGDWELAERIVQRTLVRLYRHWPQIGIEPPEAYTQRTLLFALRRHHRAAPPEELEPPLGVASDELIVAGRRLRRRTRIIGATMSVVLTMTIGWALLLLRPGGGGGVVPPVPGCMDGAPAPTAIAEPSLPILADYGLDRLAVLDLPLPQPVPLPTIAAEKVSCAIAERFLTLVNPVGLQRVNLGLADKGDARPLAALPDPEVAPGAMTVSVRTFNGNWIGTITITIAPSTRLPDRDHCDRLSFCKLSSLGNRGEVMEQYGLREMPATTAAGFLMGADAELWSVVVYTGYTMISVNITNTPDVRGALPATRPRAPLGAQTTLLALDPRLALFDPVDPSPPPTSDPPPLLTRAPSPSLTSTAAPSLSR
ncbi:hypothetical protein F4553_003567 [Allocatelliglobosispora scoriae]|uniref:RNA polymerase sigma-70 region 2 domain-containing protein n=1 Tax=Allocatelliglobosispora scoriae TaxID=643052 RepID=A0A841BS09_9ACTN|nr:hypothetical protein [Allocatelliglobosispora scoriae]MBB5870188.1 hypothetical protein [Allocatelliglobosispora scoriae]